MIIKFVPFVLRTYEWIVVAWFCTTAMHKHSSQLVVVILSMCPPIQAYLHWEFEVIINLHFQHGIEIEFKSFQSDNKNRRKFFEVASFDHPDSLVVLFTIIFIFAFQDITFYK
jgi:hypothetical protein